MLKLYAVLSYIIDLGYDSSGAFIKSTQIYLSSVSPTQTISSYVGTADILNDRITNRLMNHSLPMIDFIKATRTSGTPRDRTTDLTAT